MFILDGIASFLQSSVGVSVSGGYGGASASVSLDINALDESVNENTEIGKSLKEFTIGSEAVPLPIYTKLVPIVEAMADNFWDSGEREEIRQKKVHLDKALTDYAANKRARISNGRLKQCSQHACMHPAALHMYHASKNSLLGYIIMHYYFDLQILQ